MDLVFYSLDRARAAKDCLSPFRFGVLSQAFARPELQHATQNRQAVWTIFAKSASTSLLYFW